MSAQLVENARDSIFKFCWDPDPNIELSPKWKATVQPISS
jgi:hypothetical protein